VSHSHNSENENDNQKSECGKVTSQNMKEISEQAQKKSSVD